MRDGSHTDTAESRAEKLWKSQRRHRMIPMDRILHGPSNGRWWMQFMSLHQVYISTHETNFSNTFFGSRPSEENRGGPGSPGKP